MIVIDSPSRESWFESMPGSHYFGFNSCLQNNCCVPCTSFVPTPNTVRLLILRNWLTRLDKRAEHGFLDRIHAGSHSSGFGDFVSPLVDRRALRFIRESDIEPTSPEIDPGANHLSLRQHSDFDSG